MRKEEPPVSGNLPRVSKNPATPPPVAALSLGVLAASRGSPPGSSPPPSRSPPPSSSPTAAASPAASASSTAPITIGISLSLTGDFSTEGVAFQQGYKLWAKDVNAAGGLMGRQVKLIILNDTSSPNQGATNSK